MILKCKVLQQKDSLYFCKIVEYIKNLIEFAITMVVFCKISYSSFFDIASNCNLQICQVRTIFMSELHTII